MADLPVFYFNAEKNQYFPIKDPIPGTSRPSSSSPTAQKSAQKFTWEMDLCWETGVRASKLLQFRELYGNVWKYSETDKIADGVLEKIHVDVQTPEGLTETDALLMGGANGSLSFVEVGKVRPHFDYEVKCMPDRAWPFIKENQAEYGTIPGPMHRSARGSLRMDQIVSNLGSETSRGSLSIVKLIEPLDLDWSFPATHQRMCDVASFNCTIWTADCNSNWSRAVIGKCINLGAALVDLETADAPWVCRSKSDVFALQFIHSGNALLCGLGDGAIVTVDVREKREGSSAALISHIPYSSSDRTLGSSVYSYLIILRIKISVTNIVFECEKLFGNIYPSYTVKMASSISCLVSLQFDDHYFLASSMDGLVKLYDHHLIQRGTVQSYEGHVNSHTRIQLAVDPSEKFVMLGGEDCKLRLWNETQWYKEYIHQQVYGLKVWLGSHKGLFYMDWSGIYSDALM
ncbi:hypothetical protein I3842_09G139100 [Carya illinoinensis]|uniref:Uncharacterized protein n=1 Tax=Carya illinoinensis TaxID=32201 RepID=A0A922E3V7_CARIL|nr:hypothetical protein I3842_09G139100 [Carya illinoinensis]